MRDDGTAPVEVKEVPIARPPTSPHTIKLIGPGNRGIHLNCAMADTAWYRNIK